MGGFGTTYLQKITQFWHWEKTFSIIFGLGIGAALLRRDKKDIVLLALVLPAFLYITNWPGKSLHYLLFLCPSLGADGRQLSLCCATATVTEKKQEVPS